MAAFTHKAYAMCMDLKITHTGKFVIAAGSERQTASESYNPVLYIGIVNQKSWATQYPMQGRYNKVDDAVAAALHYGIQIITNQIKDIRPPIG